MPPITSNSPNRSLLEEFLGGGGGVWPVGMGIGLGLDPMLVGEGPNALFCGVGEVVSLKLGVPEPGDVLPNTVVLGPKILDGDCTFVKAAYLSWFCPPPLAKKGSSLNGSEAACIGVLDWGAPAG